MKPGLILYCYILYCYILYCLQGDVKLDVWSEVIQPFNLMPRFALEGTSNAVMNALVTSLLPKFMDRHVTPQLPIVRRFTIQRCHFDVTVASQVSNGNSSSCYMLCFMMCLQSLHVSNESCCRLGNDYKRWATGPSYRQARKMAAKQESLSR